MKKLFLFACLGGWSIQLNAANVTYNITGEVSYFTVWGSQYAEVLDLSSPVYGSLTFDDSGIATSGIDYLETNNLQFSLTIGAYSFTQNEQNPNWDITLGFEDGELVEMYYQTYGFDSNIAGSWMSVDTDSWNDFDDTDFVFRLGNDSSGDGSLGGVVGATGPLYFTKAAVVPIPAAVWLFGSALAGLGWMRRNQFG